MSSANRNKRDHLVKAYRDHAKELALYIDQFHHAPGLGEDILHDVFIVAAQKIDDIDFSKPIRPYLYKIARNIMLNVNSKKQRRKTEASDELDDFDIKESDRHGKAARCMLIRQTLELLPEVQRDILVLCEVQGLTANEASEILDISPNTVSSRLRLGRLKFREEFTRLEGENHV